MFQITENDINMILKDYQIDAECSSYTELQRYDYEEDDPASKNVRLIVKAELRDGCSLVLRFKNEEDAPQEVIEAQSRFAAQSTSTEAKSPRSSASRCSRRRTR